MNSFKEDNYTPPDYGKNGWVASTSENETEWTLEASPECIRAINSIWSELLIHCMDRDRRLLPYWRELLKENMFQSYFQSNRMRHGN